MRNVTTIVRFAALDVLALVDLAREQRADELWLVRSDACELTLPDELHKIEPCSVDGDRDAFVCSNQTCPVVEVLELHNYVFQKLAQLSSAGKLPKEAWLEVQLSEENDICLVLATHPSSINSYQPSIWRPLVDTIGDD